MSAWKRWQLRTALKKIRKEKAKILADDNRTAKQLAHDKKVAIDLIMDNSDGFAIIDALDLSEDGKILTRRDLEKKSFEDISELLEICLEELGKRI